ncbi:MAG: hypothetical protein LBI38_00180 [Oscillospiraceae bacterium]|jgi:capsular polysaccharide biosynthesis protein|nr:hypothetical protein [Oscillospiraceae bacterium]
MSNNEYAFDISALLRIFKKYAAVIVVFSVVSASIAFVLSEFVLHKKYSAAAKFYIENNKNQSEAVNINDINAAKNMVNTCAELFTTRNITQKLKDETGLDFTVDEMMEMINMGTSNNTEFLKITVTAEDSRTAVYMLEKFLDICTDEFEATIDSGRIRVVDSAYSNEKPVFPNVGLFAAVGFVLGFVAAYSIVFVKEILDVKIKAEDDLFKIYEIPVFAEIMCFDAKVKGEYGL